MALNPIDTTTDHGSYKGDPAPVAFGKVNDNDSYLEELANRAVPKTGGSMTGSLQWNFGGSQIQVANGGGGNAILQALNNAGNAQAQLEMRALSYQFASQGTVNIAAPQLRVEGPNIPSGQYQGYILSRLNAKPGANADYLDTQYYRQSAGGGTSWSDFNWRVGRTVDASVIGFIEWVGSNRSIVINTGSGLFTFQTNGNATANGSWINGGSDPEIKATDTLRPIQDATKAVCGLTVRLGKYLPEFNDDERDRAFVMADDAMRSNTPEVIVENVIQERYAGWATDQLIAYLVAAYQEARLRELASLERVDAMEQRLQALELAA